MKSVLDAIRILASNRSILLATTSVEIEKRHASSLLGRTWVVLYPILLLSAYVFTFAFVLGARLEGMDRTSYLLFVSGPACTWPCRSDQAPGLRHGTPLVRNVLFPSNCCRCARFWSGSRRRWWPPDLLIVLSAADLRLSPRACFLPLVLVGQILFLWGIAWILSLVAVVLPDIAYFVNLGLTFLIFISPIGFRPDMVPRVAFVSSSSSTRSPISSTPIGSACSDHRPLDKTRFPGPRSWWASSSSPPAPCSSAPPRRASRR